MSYLDGIATEIRDEVPESAFSADHSESLFRAYAVLLLAKGAEVTEEDVHNAWVAWMTDRGERHSSMVPFDQLQPETRAEDSPFVRAIRQVAERSRRI